MLQLRHCLQRVQRHNAVIVVCGGEEHRRVGFAALDVVIGRVFLDYFKVSGIVWGAVVRGPEMADCELVEAQHVQQTHLAQHPCEELWSLIGHSCDEKAPIRSAADAQLFRAGVFVLDEPFGARDEIVERVLLLALAAARVPVAPVFSTPPDVCDCVDAADDRFVARGSRTPKAGLDSIHGEQLQQRQRERVECDALHHIEPTVAKENCAAHPVKQQLPRPHDEHGHVRPILGADELLLNHVLRRIESLYLGFEHHLQLLRRGDVPIDHGGREEGLEAEEKVRVPPLPVNG
mmetsp:Transcript_36311/g.90598  ORF Transcript_36311/g.90598 Transcript_36311/m.90598 type:complete len:291 (-) Transcript_36311:1394-2266(-)